MVKLKGESGECKTLNRASLGKGGDETGKKSAHLNYRPTGDLEHICVHNESETKSL